MNGDFARATTGPLLLDQYYASEVDDDGILVSKGPVPTNHGTQTSSDKPPEETQQHRSPDITSIWLDINNTMLAIYEPTCISCGTQITQYTGSTLESWRI